MITIASHWPLSALCQRSWWPNHPFLQIVQESSWLGGILPSINLLHNLASARFFQAPGSAEPLFLAEALCNGVTAIIFPRMATEKSEGTARPAQARTARTREGNSASLPRRGGRQEDSIRQSGELVHQLLPGLHEGSTARSLPPQRRGPATTDPLQDARGPACPEGRPGPRARPKSPSSGVGVEVAGGRKRERGPAPGPPAPDLTAHTPRHSNETANPSSRPAPYWRHSRPILRKERQNPAPRRPLANQHSPRVETVLPGWTPSRAEGLTSPLGRRGVD